MFSFTDWSTNSLAIPEEFCDSSPEKSGGTFGWMGVFFKKPSSIFFFSVLRPLSEKSSRSRILNASPMPPGPRAKLPPLEPGAAGFAASAPATWPLAVSVIPPTCNDATRAPAGISTEPMTREGRAFKPPWITIKSPLAALIIRSSPLTIMPLICKSGGSTTGFPATGTMVCTILVRSTGPLSTENGAADVAC